MRAHCLQHVPFEGPGSIGPWLERAGYAVTATRFFENAELPEVEGIDFLLVMGGPMSVHDEAEFPWLAAEKAFIREVVRSGRPVLGVCLGAQLIAEAMGGRVFPNPVKEIGWFPVYGMDPGKEGIFSFPPSATVFHWHGETFTPPPGAVNLARSAVCAHQAFQLGRRTMALQFHLETTPETAEEMVRCCGNELISSPSVQSGDRICAAGPDVYRAMHGLMEEVLDFLHRGRCAGSPS